MSKNDGGPAFPLENPRMMENDELFRQFPGMSLRDWFEGQALPAIIIATSAGQHLPALSPEQTLISGLARDAYELADAMLAERGKNNE